MGEYEFAPGSVTLEIKEGEQREVAVVATRVAYR